MQSPKRAATRAANMDRIKVVARAQLARVGAPALSLREVAREMNQTSSALYRYYANRDELLTALIVDAYNDLGAVAERAEAEVDRGDLLGRWRAATSAIRGWASANPHEYALIYGSPVPGYSAPELTIPAATRVTLVIAGIVADRYRNEEASEDQGAPPSRELVWEAVSTAMPGVTRDVAIRAILVWSSLFGFISFELFGHFVGSVDDADELFARFVDDAAARIGVVA